MFVSLVSQSWVNREVLELLLALQERTCPPFKRCEIMARVCNAAEASDGCPFSDISLSLSRPSSLEDRPLRL